MAKRAARLSPLRVAAAVVGARALIEVLEDWPSSVAAPAHRAQTERVLGALGWTENTEFAAAVREAVDGLTGEFPVGFALDRIEWTSALVKRLDGLGEVPIGGDGGGVQVLTVTEARARTFDHLVLCGLVRGVFPRQAVDDPLLPDLVRARLALDVLPEMPVKARSADEERYLFAQLVSAAPTVDLSWHLRADGRRMAPSPFVERLRAVDGVGMITTMPALWAVDEPRPGPRPAYEHTVLTAMDRAEVGLESRLDRAIVEGRRASPRAGWSVATDRLATARLEVVDAAETVGAAPAMGPWFGGVGSAAEPGARLWVTHLESVATCPWRAFVGRRLGVRPLPDPHLGLPDLDQRLLGQVVHEVLESIVTGGVTGKKLAYAEALEREPMVVPWPAKKDLEAVLEAAAARVVFDEGLSGFGLARLLAAQARPVLEVARTVEWGDVGQARRRSRGRGRGRDPIRGVGADHRLPRRSSRRRRGSATDYKTGKAPVDREATIDQGGSSADGGEHRPGAAGGGLRARRAGGRRHRTLSLSPARHRRCTAGIAAGRGLRSGPGTHRGLRHRRQGHRRLVDGGVGLPEGRGAQSKDERALQLLRGCPKPVDAMTPGSPRPWWNSWRPRTGRPMKS